MREPGAEWAEAARGGAVRLRVGVVRERFELQGKQSMDYRVTLNVWELN